MPSGIAPGVGDKFIQRVGLDKQAAVSAYTTDEQVFKQSLIVVKYLVRLAVSTFRNGRFCLNAWPIDGDPNRL
jgi:hypothetical protein